MVRLAFALLLLAGCGPWQRPVRSTWASGQGLPHHFAPDVVTNPGAGVDVTAKFAYGFYSVDLEGEEVKASIRLRRGWVTLGTATTDDEGWVRVDVPPNLLREPGVYPVRLVVADGTAAEARVFVLARGTHIAVFDVDGTLTRDDLELLDQITGGTADAYPGADDIVWHYARRGVQPVYITARFYLFGRMTRRWLADGAFPPGPLFATRSLAESGASDADGAHTFKRKVLADLQGRLGLVIEAAYGNADTDVCAYATTHIPPAHTFIIGPNGGHACGSHPASQAVHDYPSHLEEL